MDRLAFLNKELNTNYNSLDDVNWSIISISQIFSDSLKIELIREFKDKIDWYHISKHQKLSENFIREFKNEVNWCRISKCQELSEEFIREFKDKIDWGEISRYQKLSEEFIREFQNKVNWYLISEYQNLSENFIREFQNKVYWSHISIYQKLSENFIREFQDKVDWYNISIYQKLSEKLILEHIDVLNLQMVYQYQKLSKKIRNEFKLVIDKGNWLYKSTEFKKLQLIKNGLYECHEDYFIAYKAIRNDRYSHFNFQYQYLPNEVYECHCDCTNIDISFGLSAWTYDNAKNYNDSGLIVKVKVRYEDVGILLYDNKIRCSKIEILE